MERETGIEPATSSLGSWRSTAELLPLNTDARLSPMATRLQYSGHRSQLAVSNIRLVGPLGLGILRSRFFRRIGCQGGIATGYVFGCRLRFTALLTFQLGTLLLVEPNRKTLLVPGTRFAPARDLFRSGEVPSGRQHRVSAPEVGISRPQPATDIAVASGSRRQFLKDL